MDRSLNVEQIAEDLPNLDTVLDDARLRPMGVVGGVVLVVPGVVLQVVPGSGFWSAVVAGVLIFVGIPLFCVGLAAPEPNGEDDPFRIGIDLDPEQRRIVGGGALLVVLSAMVVAAFGPHVGFVLPLWLAAAVLAVVGCVLILTGFIAWTARVLTQPTGPTRR